MITEHRQRSRSLGSRLPQPDACRHGPRAARPRHDERGSATMLMAGVVCVVLALGAAAMCIAAYVAASHQARGAADLSALSAAVEFQRGGDACAAARLAAEANDVRVERCTWVGDRIDFVITVDVARRVSVRVPELPRSVTARARAGPRATG